jgi:hypothetical protein
MKEAINEHHITPISFSMVEGNRPPKRETRAGISFDLERSQFALPTVTLTNRRLYLEQKRNKGRCCTASCFLRMIILVFPFVFYKQIQGILSLVPQTMDFAPRIQRDYSSVKSFHDLSSQVIRPWCFVSFLEVTILE